MLDAGAPSPGAACHVPGWKCPCILVAFPCPAVGLCPSPSRSTVPLGAPQALGAMQEITFAAASSGRASSTCVARGRNPSFACEAKEMPTPQRALARGQRWQSAEVKVKAAGWQGTGTKGSGMGVLHCRAPTHPGGCQQGPEAQPCPAQPRDRPQAHCTPGFVGTGVGEASGGASERCTRKSLGRARVGPFTIRDKGSHQMQKKKSIKGHPASPWLRKDCGFARQGVAPEVMRGTPGMPAAPILQLPPSPSIAQAVHMFVSALEQHVSVCPAQTRGECSAHTSPGPTVA